jgi:hypothetical protein
LSSALKWRSRRSSGRRPSRVPPALPSLRGKSARSSFAMLRCVAGCHISACFHQVAHAILGPCYNGAQYH